MVGDTPDGPIHWRLHLPVPPAEVHRALATDAGRASFWAETTEGPDGIHFRFPNRVEHRGRAYLGPGSSPRPASRVSPSPRASPFLLLWRKEAERAPA